MLGWDAAAMMPPGGGAARGDQLAVLAGVAHGLLTAPAVADDLAAAEAALPAAAGPAAPGPDPNAAPGAAANAAAWRAANLRLMRHAHTRATALPAELVEAQARANSACEKVWREARRANDFALVRPHLAEVLRLVREQAAALAPALGLAPYDALMDGYQRGVAAADVAPVFAAYEALPAPRAARGRGAPGPPARPRPPRRPLPGGHAGGAVPPPGRAHRPGFRPRAAGPLGASVLRRHADRRAHHHPLRRGRLHPGGARGGARDRPRAVRTRPADRACPPAGRRGGRHGGAREPVADHRDAGLPLGRVPVLARAGAARHLRRRPGAVSPGQPGSAVAARRARLHPRRRRRDDLSGACHPALPAGAGAGRRRPGGGRPAGGVERRARRAARA